MKPAVSIRSSLFGPPQSELVALAILILVASCRAADDDSDEEKTMDQKPASTRSTDGGATGRGGDTPAMMPEIECGTTKCTVPEVARGVVKPCCEDASASKCGFTSAGTQNRCVASMPHSVCPTVMVVGTMAPGCCTAKGQCGVDASAIGMGCVELGAAASMGGSSIDAPAPQSWTPDGSGAAVPDAQAGTGADVADGGGGEAAVPNDA